MKILTKEDAWAKKVMAAYLQTQLERSLLVASKVAEADSEEFVLLQQAYQQSSALSATLSYLSGILSRS